MNKSLRTYTLYIFQAIVFVCILVFVAQFLIQPQPSNAEISSVVEQTIHEEDISALSLANNKEVKRYLGLDPSSFEGITYYKNKDPMQGSEIVIAKFQNNEQKAEFENAIETRIESQKNIYEGYLPEEATRVSNAVVYVQANYGIYIVSDDASAILSRFQASLNSSASAHSETAGVKVSNNDSSVSSTEGEA